MSRLGRGGMGARRATTTTARSQYGDDGVPTAEISFWVNDRLAATAEAPEPVPEEYVDGTLVREQPFLYDRGQSNDPLHILYEPYHLHEIRD